MQMYQILQYLGGSEVGHEYLDVLIIVCTTRHCGNLSVMRTMNSPFRTLQHVWVPYLYTQV